MEISFSALSYFRKTARLQHLSKAAAELHIAQPSLSRTIRALEEELGVPLFDHKGRNIVLNRYGEILLKYADRILLAQEALRQELSAVRDQDVSTVTLSLYAASKIVPSLLTAFRRQYPQIRLQILQQDAANSGTARANLSLFSSITPVENSHSVTLLEEEITLALPESDPRAKLPSVSLDAFANDDFISLQPGKSLRTIMDTYCQMAGFVPNIHLECDSPNTVREFIQAGLGVSFVPRITWKSVAGEKVALVPISTPKCHRYIGLSWEEDGYLSPAAEKLRDFLIANFEPYARG